MLTHIRDVSPKKAVYLCNCGVETIAFKSNVKRGSTKSCGCFRRAVSSSKCKTHGHKSNGKRSRVYVAWVNMKGRCNNKNRKDAKNYIGREITYCERWESFENFLMDMGEPDKGLSLDRIDNSLGYYKENCRWATASVQNLNKRNCVRYTFQGKTQTLAEWSRELGIGRGTLLKRLQRAVDINLAFTVKSYLRVKNMPTNDNTTGLIRIA